MNKASFRLVMYEKSSKYHKTVKEKNKLKNSNSVWYYHWYYHMVSYNTTKELYI